MNLLSTGEIRELYTGKDQNTYFHYGVKEGQFFRLIRRRKRRAAWGDAVGKVEKERFVKMTAEREARTISCSECNEV